MSRYRTVSDMKKKPFISVVLLFIALLLAFSPFSDIIDSVKEKAAVYLSAPTVEESEELNSLIESNTYYYFNHLSEELKKAYRIMYSSFSSFEPDFSMEIAEEDINNVFVAVLYDNPHIFWVDNNYKYIVNKNTVTFEPLYRFSQDEAETIGIAMQNEVNKIISLIDTDASEYEKELFIHDTLCNRTTYDESTLGRYGDTAFSSLLDGKAICEGYSRAMQLLLDAAGIKNYLAVGDAVSNGKAEPHMWNIVNIDGMNYHLDATWNDSGQNDEIVYFYFNADDNYIRKTHLNIQPENNNCTSMQMNYYVVEKSYIQSFDGFNEHISQTAELLSSGCNRAEFVFEKTADFNTAVKEISDNRNFFGYITSSVNQSGRNLSTYEIEYYTIDENNYLCIVFKEE